MYNFKSLHHMSNVNNAINASRVISKMKVLLRIVILFYVCFYQLCDAARSIQTLTTQIGASYVLTIRQDGIQPTECYINDDKNKYMIDLLHEDVQPEPHNKNSDNINKAQDSDIIKSLGNGICGFKMDNVSKTTTPKWTLTVVDKKGKSYNSTTRVFIEDTGEGYMKIIREIGDFVAIPCASLNKQIDYCEIHHPNGEVVLSGTESCLFNEPLSKATDFGIWKCVLGYKTNMAPVVKQYEVIPTQFNIINTWKNETETRVNLGCSVSNPKDKKISYCLMVRPDGKQFKLLPGLATDRYTTLYTNLSNHVCSLEIAKPLEANEWGIWRCEVHNGMYNGRDIPLGGFITLSSRSNRFIRSVTGAEAKVPKDIFLHVNSSMTVSCRVPYSSTYCYMRGPDGKLYPENDDRAITLGLCTLTKDKVELSDNGTWFCGFGKRTGEPDDVYQFQVHVAEVLTIRPEYELVEARDGGSAYLKCTTRGIGDYPLKYCRFLSPDGHMYQISAQDKSSDRIIYDGRGLEYGDCGIKIRRMELSDIGKWTCMTRIGADFKEEEVHTNIDLALSNNLSIASVLGISFGVSLVAVGGAFVCIRKWRERRANIRTPSAAYTRNTIQRSSNSSHSSNGSNVAFNIMSRQSIHDQNYDTIQNPSIRYRVS